MKTVEKINIKTTQAQEEENWEEIIFWKIDSFLAKFTPYIFVILTLYMIVHLIIFFFREL